MKRKFTILLFLLFVINIFSPIPIWAESNNIKVDIKIQKEYPTNENYDTWEKMHIYINFSAEQLQSGDNFVIELPEELEAIKQKNFLF